MAGLVLAPRRWGRECFRKMARRAPEPARSAARAMGGCRARSSSSLQWQGRS